jgi:phosphoribosylanthranilate isomerase
MRPHFPAPAANRVSTKICGFLGLTDAVLAAAEAGAAAIGINFWPKSKRYHPLAHARQWLPQVPTSLNRVAVLVNATEDEIEAILASECIDTLQFHGDEPDELVQRYLDRGVACIRALAVRQAADLEKIAHCPAPTILLDAYAPGTYGGTGHTCDWELARQAVLTFPQKKIILSGGLTPQNVAQAVQEVRPAGVDVASGVEISPGIKDAAMVREFVQAVQGVNQ